MVADSPTGAYVQFHYQTDTSDWRDTPSTRGISSVRGWACVTNNAVNVVGTTVGGGAALTGFLLLA
nr:hypothetical protein [Salinibacter altiplanensis]